MCNENPPGCEFEGYHHNVSKETFMPIFGTKDISDHFYSYLKYEMKKTGYMVDKDDKKIEPQPKIPTPEELSQLTSSTAIAETTQKPKTTDAVTTGEPGGNTQGSSSKPVKPETTASSANIFSSISTIISIFCYKLLK